MLTVNGFCHPYQIQFAMQSQSLVILLVGCEIKNEPSLASDGPKSETLDAKQAKPDAVAYSLP